MGSTIRACGFDKKGEDFFVDQRTVLANLLQALEHVKARPAMYFRREEPEPARTFLNGFMVASAFAGLPEPDRKAVEKSRGWEGNSFGPEHQMLAKGWSARQIVAEMLEIEAESFRRLLAKLEAEPDSSSDQPAT